SATEKGLLVATPLLGGALFRIVMGALTDHVGARRTGLIGIGLTFVPLLLGWLAAGSLPRLFAVALLLGVPGASFAVALPLVSLWFCLFYGITFGGFVGLASFLGILFHEQYGVPKVAAGDLTALCVFAGSFMRPVGGLLADRHGGIPVLSLLYGAVALLLLGVAALPPLWLATPLFVLALALLGAGNGSVFRLGQ